MKTVLVLGSGGREHAIAWKLSENSDIHKVYVAPGNGGTENEWKSANVHLSLHNFDEISAWCQHERIAMVVVGPEAPLADGIVDFLQQRQIPCFGPSKAAARLEWDKCYAKEIMQSCNIPTAKWKSFTQFQEAIDYIGSNQQSRYVIKANGLAAGKGVTICCSQEEAETAIIDILINNKFGEKKVIIEECLHGDEISVLAFCDGANVSIMPYVHDYKRLYDGDLGPNTGGMGAFAPYTKVSDDDDRCIREEIIFKIISKMKSLGHPYNGILYAGIMLTNDGPKVLEFNCRLGDPEAQVLLPLLKSDLFNILEDCIKQNLNRIVEWHPDYAVGVVLVSRGYPGPYQTDVEIHSINKAATFAGIEIFHAGTALTDNMDHQVLTKKGRVMTVTAKASSLSKASIIAYRAIDCINFEGKMFRKDIGAKSWLDSDRLPDGLTYKACGVNIGAGNDLVANIQSLAKSTLRRGCSEEIGGFASLLDYSATTYQSPSIIVTTDGVGTKLMICQEINYHNSIGIDLVAMSVNDLLARGAEAVAMLDYISYSSLGKEVIQAILSGIATGCRIAGCALVGGETAQMPGLYPVGTYDLAGFAIGFVERGQDLPEIDTIIPGDKVIGIASSGIHSNGFSLIRRIVEQKQLHYDMPAPFSVHSSNIGTAPMSLGKALLIPTKIYCRSLLSVLRSSLVKAYAHITGGGLVDNVSRILPQNCKAVIDAHQWKMADVFKWIANEGNVYPDEMLKTFNCGIGAVLICSANAHNALLELLAASGEEYWSIGNIESIRPGELKIQVQHLYEVLYDQNIVVKNISVSLPKKYRLAVLISGTGTNLQAIIDYAKAEKYRIEVVLVISNVDKVAGLERARQNNIENIVIDHKRYTTRKQFEKELDHVLKEKSVNLICLAGFMRILTIDFVNQWKGKIINTHPSLLPAFPGCGAVLQALTAGVKITGCTIHFVEAKVDSGPIIVQESVPILPDDSETTLSQRIKTAEHRCYPQAIDLIIKEQVKYVDGKLSWLTSHSDSSDYR
ncbi:Trifunctional purine biosynthetic protein adenosine-3 [Trichoplax sp. H2]|nr:Trifunctional purine biosynthetic protein adenosine-3 [Trichoplax sp. H2]|eukprot:RDD37795.1 Trifunctional purine biosynthetic protein adenosine-3 [Trichoplax sp. H2]